MFHFYFILSVGYSNQLLQQSFLLILLIITALSKSAIAMYTSALPFLILSN